MPTRTQVFSAFIHGFSTYSPLLARIQAEFDQALNDGVRCAQENVEMRTLMARNEMQRERAAANVRGQVLAGEELRAGGGCSRHGSRLDCMQPVRRYLP